MTLEELLKQYLEDDEKTTKFLEDMKSNKIYTAGEENLDIRYGKLQEDFTNKTKEHEEATKLIEQLKESGKGNEDLQAKITEYESQVAELQKELEQTKIESALKVALSNAKVTDVDYVAFKVKEKNKELKLDEDGNIKGIDDTLKDIKTTYPNFFEGEKKKEIDVKELGKGNQQEAEPTSLVEALSQKYTQGKNEL